LWWLLVAASALIPTCVPFEPVWPQSRLEAAVSEVGFARGRYALFQRLVDEAVSQRPALVLVVPDEADRSMDFVLNDPQLDADVLFGRFRRGQTNLVEVHRNFPDLALYLFEPHFNIDEWRLTPVPRQR
jgi:hypothetical protein